MKFDMAAEIRERAGKGIARQLRRSGKIPGVLYGQGKCLLLTLDPEDVTKILQAHAGRTALITLNIAGDTSKTARTALLRDYQVDPLTEEVLHVDLFEISMSKPIRLKVPVSVVGGVPAGVKEGGLLQHNLREMSVECLPAAIPDSIEVDASQLLIGEGLHVREIAPREGIKFLDEADAMVVSVAAPMSEAKLEALLTSAAVTGEGKEPEVISKGKEETPEEVAAAAAEKGAAPGEPKAAAAAGAEKKEGKEGKEAPKAEKKEAKEEKKK
ncbi:MAG: 50S ribosomal protein L25 [Nitrospirae bacterium]|nr:50S ribosomal protein L25 [Nitrospirota bacterium]